MSHPEKTITKTAVTPQTQDALNDFLSAMPILELRGYLKEMYMSSMVSPRTEDQTIRDNITFGYQVIDNFLENLEPHCRIRVTKENR